MKWAIPILIAILAAGVAGAETYNTPVIDGVIVIGPGDWDANDLAFSEEADDNRYYPNDPDMVELFVTWNADTLYVGVVTERDPGGFGNGYLVFIDTDAQAGITGATDFSSADYFARNITFSTMGAEVVIGGWNLPDNMDVKFCGIPESTTPVEGARGVADEISHHIEAAIPWSSLYDSTTRPGIPTGTTLRFIAVIVGGDNSGAYDAMPTSSTGIESDPETPYDATVDLDVYKEVVVDGNNDGLPDEGYTPVERDSWGGIKSLYSE